MRAHPVDRALGLWASAIRGGDAGDAAFRTVYADPLLVNGAATEVRELVERARMLHTAFTGLGCEVLHRVDAPESSAFAFRLSGEHTGPLVTPLGDIAATNRRLTVAGIDIFTIAEDTVTRCGRSPISSTC
jgi:hypothetical protein